MIKSNVSLNLNVIKRGVSNADLAVRLSEIGIHETKASIDSKISRGSFSACFLIQCLSVIGCLKIEIEDYESSSLVRVQPNVESNRNPKNEK